MTDNRQKRKIAYRCSECGVATVGFLHPLTDDKNMLRIRCECRGSALDIKAERGGKLHLSVPCVYCKAEHGFTVSRDIVYRDEMSLLSCPFSGMDIAFIGSGEELQRAIDRSADELSRIMASLEAESINDIQPMDVDEDDCEPDPAIFDTINFVLRDLEAEGNVKCPCMKGPYSLRFTSFGMQACCDSCGATYDFHARSATLAEEYVSLGEIILK